MRQTIFDVYHPSVQMVYFLAVILFVMLAFQPVYLVIGFICGFLFQSYLVGVRAAASSLVWQLPLIAVMCLINPIFSASGSTLLLRVLGRNVYFESLAYGACFGLMLVASLCWFSCAAQVVSTDKVMSVLGNAAPVVALMVSMVSRLVPELLHRGQSIDAVQRACSVTARAEGARGVLHDKVRLSTVLVGWAFEDSFETADSMRARGWGCGRRTVYQRSRFRTRDGVAIAAIASLVALAAPLAYTACSGYAFYPTMTPLALWWGYIPYIVLLLLPLGVEFAARLAGKELDR